jgi:quercetin dioxygenase-like cupin family protein
VKLPLFATTFVATAALLMGGEGNPGVTYIGHDKVSAALTKSGPLHKQSDLLVMGSHRSGAGSVELHEKETDIFYVVDGEATFITGGKMIGSKVTSPGQRVGTDIQGGQAYHLTKGDVMVIPAGIPHWFKEVPNSVSYFVVKVLKP